MEMAGKGDGNAIKSHLACIDCNVTHSLLLNVTLKTERNRVNTTEKEIG